MSVTLLTGCGSDPVYDDLENFLNVEMAEVNADFPDFRRHMQNAPNKEFPGKVQKSHIHEE